MALSSLFDDFPVLVCDNGDRRRRRRSLLDCFIDAIEDQLDHKVGHTFRRLPAVSFDLDSDYKNPTKKRKLLSGTVSTYQPKSQVMVSTKDNKFKLSLDTSNYQPQEISVKVVDDKLAISAKHEAKGDGVYEYSEMYRSFSLPENVDPNTVTSHLSSSGELTVEAPLKLAKEKATRTIPVEIESANQVIESSKSPSKKQK